VYLPQFTKETLRPLPADAPAMPGSPADLRIYHNHRTPVGIGPGDPAAAELIWRLMVSVRLHGEWTAFDLGALATDLLIEQGRPNQDKRIVDSHFTRNLDQRSDFQRDPETVIRQFGEAIKALIEWRLIATDQDRQTAWLTQGLRTLPGSRQLPGQPPPCHLTIPAWCAPRTRPNPST
jgi:hypothetical protein